MVLDKLALRLAELEADVAYYGLSLRKNFIDPAQFRHLSTSGLSWSSKKKVIKIYREGATRRIQELYTACNRLWDLLLGKDYRHRKEFHHWDNIKKAQFHRICCALAGYASPLYGYRAPVAAYHAAPVYSRVVAPAVTAVHHGAAVSHVSSVSSYRSQHPVATPVARYASVHTAPAVATVHTVPAVAKVAVYAAPAFSAVHAVPTHGYGLGYGYGLGTYGLRYGHDLSTYGYGLGHAW
ncbi:hypothetical protein HPB47_005248 [Ixodes persulcatus]|uniref:Uncharacterized protein n=1 Tax=Ixodes persulcatus TaxID=34615 RepID=A0AC60PDK7_IXOPE|nr:hypothetical protein HPB47_005248 [Ixodes persulcatus]